MDVHVSKRPRIDMRLNDKLAQLLQQSRELCGKHNKHARCAQNPFCIAAGINSTKKLFLGRKSAWKDIAKSAGVVEDADKALKRQQGDPIGLRNLGATCYLNSFLQMMFHNRAIRNEILAFDVESLEKDSRQYTVVKELQLLLTRLALSSRNVVDPSDFVLSLGIESSEQQDAQEFTNLFLSYISNSFRKSHEPSLIDKLFNGTMIYTTKCDSCDSVFTSKSLFHEICLQIRGKKSLIESLNDVFFPEFLQGDNAYFCQTCNSKCSAVRTVSLDQKSLPPFLNLQLMRFYYDVKTNSRKKVKRILTIARKLDMSPEWFVDKNMEANSIQYELVAVLQHNGESAYSGHYIVDVVQESDASKSSWLRFDDETMSVLSESSKTETGLIDLTESEALDSDNFRSSNAYMLVYKRRERFNLDPDDLVPFPAWCQEIVNSENQSLEETCFLHSSSLKSIQDFVCQRQQRILFFSEEYENWKTSLSTAALCADDWCLVGSSPLKKWLKGEILDGKVSEVKLSTEIKDLSKNSSNFHRLRAMLGAGVRTSRAMDPLCIHKRVSLSSLGSFKILPLESWRSISSDPSASISEWICLECVDRDTCLAEEKLRILKVS